MPSQIDEIRERIDIIQLISEYLQLKKAGANYKAPCPFHSEKTPSFFVSPSKQIFKCFGCGASGDIFQFIMKIEGIEFKEALQVLAKKAGVELKKEPIKQKTERQNLYDICEIATKFFEKQLEDSTPGKKAKEYLESRGITPSLMKEWRIGYSPNNWRSLSDFLVGKGYSRDEIIKAGLALASEKGGTPYDRFRGRIIFPITDLQANPIGFGGRIFHESPTEKKDGEAKYINTPITPIYDKSRALFGLNKSKLDIRKEDKVVLVEGYTDVILSHKSGVTNIVSSSGTSLTPQQLQILSRYTKNIDLAFDMDIAGESATKRGIDLAQMLSFNIKIISLPDKKDPADVAQENPQLWETSVKNAKTIIDFYFEKTFAKFDKSKTEGKKEISKVLLSFFARIQNRIEEAECVSRLSKELNIKEEAIWEELHKAKEALQKDQTLQRYVPQIIPEEKEQIKDRKRKLEERLLTLLLKEKEHAKKQELITYEFSFEKGKELFGYLKENEKIPEELTSFVSELELQFEVEKEKGEIDVEKEVKFCINCLSNIKKAEKIREIIGELKKAEEIDNKETINKLLNKINDIQ
jgi:DNA primase